MFQDSPECLAKAIEYLRKAQDPRGVAPRVLQLAS